MDLRGFILRWHPLGIRSERPLRDMEGHGKTSFYDEKSSFFTFSDAGEAPLSNSLRRHVFPSRWHPFWHPLFEKRVYLAVFPGPGSLYQAANRPPGTTAAFKPLAFVAPIGKPPSPRADVF